MLKTLKKRVRSNPVVVGLLMLVAGATWIFGAGDLVTRTVSLVSQVVTPHASDHAALEALDLDVRLEYFEEKFGVAKSVFDLCDERPCPDPAPDSLRMYIHETADVVVRAIFEGERLEMYLVTVTSAELSPEMAWLDWDLGPLGDRTFADALGAIETVDGPTDVAIHLGPQSTAYAEVVSGGPPGRYRGLVLAWSPDGQAFAFDRAAADELSETIATDEGPDAARLAAFRSASEPNTYGEYRDDGGYVSSLVRDADEVISLLYVGSEL